jgi:hypothetical protein
VIVQMTTRSSSAGATITSISHSRPCAERPRDCDDDDSGLRPLAGARQTTNGVGVQYKRATSTKETGPVRGRRVAADGSVSNLVRLTDTPFSYPEVTESGDLFAGTLATGSSRWDYYRIGKL